MYSIIYDHSYPIYTPFTVFLVLNLLLTSVLNKYFKIYLCVKIKIGIITFLKLQESCRLYEKCVCNIKMN